MTATLDRPITDAERRAALPAAIASLRKKQTPKMDAYELPSEWATDCVIMPHGMVFAPYQLKIMDTVFSEFKCAAWGPHTIGKCFAYGEMVRLADGRRVPAESLIGGRFAVRSFDQVSLSVRESAAMAFDNGVRDVVEIETDGGRTIVRTLNHPLWGDVSPRRYSLPEYSVRTRPQGGWVEAGDLRVGSVIAAYSGGNGGYEYPITDDEIRLLAYLIGDGGLTGGGVRFSQDNPAILSEFANCCQSLGSNVRHIGGCDYYVSSGRVLARTRDWGIYGKDSFDKAIPGWVYQMGERQLCVFLSRLFACDGWASVLAGGSAQIGYCSVSESIARDVQSLLLSLGIRATLRIRRTAWWHNGERRKGFAFDVTVCAVEDLLRFCDLVGIFGKELAVSEVRRWCETAHDGKTEKWRHHGLPEHMRWEKVRRIRHIRDVPTVGISVPGDETFLTDFAEHNTTTSAITVLFALCKFEAEARAGRIGDWKIVTTASYWRQLQHYLWPSIRMWYRRLDWNKIGMPPLGRHQVLQMGFKTEYGEAFAVDPINFEGAHADLILVINDEAKDIPQVTWEKQEGIYAGAGEDVFQTAYTLAVSTPGPPIGTFAEICHRKPGYEDWTPVHVTSDDAIAAGRMSARWRRQRRRQWGVDSAVYQNRVEGNFYTGESVGVIPLAWLEAANRRWLDAVENGKVPKTLTAIGVDLADQGDDSTVFAPRYDWFVDRLRALRKERPRSIVGRLYNVLVALGGIAFVDVLPNGSAIVDWLRELAVSAQTFNGSEKAAYMMGDVETRYRDRSGHFTFGNRRSHGMWVLREMLDPEYDPDLALPPDDMLTGDLTTPMYEVTSNGVIVVESKEKFKVRLGRSPDRGDAVMIACYPHDIIEDHAADPNAVVALVGV